VTGQRRARLAGAAVAVAAAVVAAGAWVGAGGGTGRPGPGRAAAVVAADEQGRELARAALPASGRFALQYVHSVYRAQVTETFAAAGDGFRLVAVASPSEAALDYYELEGRRRVQGGAWLLEPAGSPRLASLPLVATEVGRRTLVVDGRHLPLYRPSRDPVRVVVSIRR
jgi:hypothetical protein